ncbi:MAG: phage tail assembly protein [Rhodobacteraceae bacterium]|nr:phage tail assembly protein [Paracoccaceae bacterium]
MSTSKLNRVTLSAPLDRGGGDTITELVVMKPTVGALRGLQLAMVQMQDVNALAKLLPRITQPPLATEEVFALDPADFAALANIVSLFFMTQAQLNMVLIDHQPD